MKALLANKLLLAIFAGIVTVSIGSGVYFGFINKDTSTKNTKTISDNTKTETSASDDFQRTGQNSFGLAVCDEMTKDEVATAIGKPILKTEDYSNSGSTGCEYLVTDTSFVIIDVGFGDMANQKKGLEALDRTIKTDGRIKLENMLAYSENGLNDIYMNVAPGQKYVRVGRSSTTVVDEETLINLAIATEAKIRSYK
jgi:hypothetical protein